MVVYGSLFCSHVRTTDMEDYREQMFLRRKDKKPLYVEASRHKPNPNEFVLLVSRAQCGERGTDMEESRQNQRP